MNLVSLLFGLPFTPIKGVVAIADVIRQEADRKLYDPSNVRRELERLEEAREAGEISAEEEARLQQQILDRMIGPAQSPAASADGETSDDEPLVGEALDAAPQEDGLLEDELLDGEPLQGELLDAEPAPGEVPGESSGRQAEPREMPQHQHRPASGHHREG